MSRSCQTDAAVFPVNSNNSRITDIKLFSSVINNIMSSHNKTLHLLASKLGLGEEEKVLSKAAEFQRLLQTKSVAGSNLSDTSKVVICLDLAAGLFGVELDTKTAIKYSGLRPIAYASNRKTVENLLELNTSKLTVPLLCIALQCTAVQDVAEKILEEYRKCSKIGLDLSLPQYVCMAVFQACRINRVKVSKVKLNEKCRLKPAQWAKLEADWTAFVNEKFAEDKKKKGRPAKNATKADEPKEMETETKDEGPTEAETEPYEDWKRRMLETAYKELKELEQKEKENKQKSPRKTTQKDTARKTPQKSLTRCTPQKDVLKITPQKSGLRNTPLKDLSKMSPLKDGAKGTPLKSKETPQKEEPKSIVEEMSPRRSPRKTPQKFSPYTTPTKSKGVRLLFPNHF